MTKPPKSLSVPSKNIRIAFLSDNLIIGGVEKVLIEIANYLISTSKYNVKVYTLFPVKEPFFLQYFQQHHITHVSYLPRFPSNLLFFKIINRLIRLFFFPIQRRLLSLAIRKEDIIVDFKNGCFHEIIKNIPDRPKIAWIHGSIIFFRDHIKFSLNQYDRVICLTDSFLRDLSELHPDLQKKLLRIYNPINTEQIRASANQKLDTLQPIKLPKDRFFLSVSRLDNDKDIETIIRGFHKFTLQNKNAGEQLVIIGEGRTRKRLESLTRELLIDNRVHFLGKIDEPYIWMKHCQAMILSSFSEGFGFVLAEGMALGTTLIASDCPSSPREILQNGRAGALFEPGNSDMLAEILTRSGKNELPVKQYKKHMAQFLVQLNIRTIGKQIDLVLEQLLGRKS